ncbi:MAG TPA: hypothetical protein PLN54_11425 [Flavobacteriales bacterium]|nr:hypothetical protein [Flavobacteriales bacterium]
MLDPGPPVFYPERHQRRSLRMRTHDYASPGLYFVTFNTKERHRWFGEVRDGCMHLNANGQLAREHWLAIPDHHGHVRIHVFTIMPDHVHGILELVERPARSPQARTDGRPNGAAPGSLGAIIGSYRAGVVRAINLSRSYVIRGLWQRGYHDVIIRNERAFQRITGYIQRHPPMVG